MRPLLAAVLAALLALPAAIPAAAYQCHIGKPSYCFKYGGDRCEKWNSAKNKKAACQAWTSACIDCHTAIPECLGHTRPPAESAQCTKCSAEWSACMKRADRKFWKNRLTRH